MIFVTIGSMFPFDRLIRVMDGWAVQAIQAGRAGRGDIIAQIGDGTYVPQHMQHIRRLSQADFVDAMSKAEVIVAHAGMGTVITAGRFGRPLVILPRIEAWGEHTTDHQIATANWLRGKPGIFVADTDADLPDVIETARTAGGATAHLSPVADPAFTTRLRGAILDFFD